MEDPSSPPSCCFARRAPLQTSRRRHPVPASSSIRRPKDSTRPSTRLVSTSPAGRNPPGLVPIASQLPGVQLIGPPRDPLGRHGTAVAYGLPQPQGRASKVVSNELIFDPQTSALLAEQWVVVQRTNETPFPPGTVIES